MRHEERLATGQPKALNASGDEPIDDPFPLPRKKTPLDVAFAPRRPAIGAGVVATIRHRKTNASGGRALDDHG
jgi:hypothetical protein